MAGGPDRVYAEVCPDPFDYDIHHIVPLSWGGPDIASNRITISPNTHRRIHVGIDACVLLGGPENVDHRRFGKAWPYVVRAWDGADPARRTRTL